MRGVSFETTHRSRPGLRTAEIEPERLRRTGVGWNQPDREVSIRILLYRLWWVDGPAPWPTSKDTTMTGVPPPDEPPGWAIRQATSDLPSGSKTSEVTALAWDLADAAAERLDERHDEYDDPDQGGEA